MSGSKAVKEMPKSRKMLRLVLVVAVVLAVAAVAISWVSLFGSTAVAPGQPTVQAERLDATHIGIKIEFPVDVSGEFSGFILGRHFDCKVPSSKVIYCIGPLDSQLRSGLFYLYAAGSDDPMLEMTVTVLTAQQDGEQTVQDEQDGPSDSPSVNSANQPSIDPNKGCPPGEDQDCTK